MRSPVWTLACNVWLRHRWLLAACAAVWLALAALAFVLPRSMWLPSNPDDGPNAAAVLIVVACFAPAFVFILYVFSAIPVETPIDAPQSGFPVRTFTLPVGAVVLVAVPMLQAITGALVAWAAWGVLGFVWAAWGGLVPTAAGVGAALIEPALLTATLIAWLQALVWRPFPWRFARVVVAAPVLTAVGMGPSVAATLGAPPIAVLAAQIALLPAAFGVALAGVARARRGDGPHWGWPSWLAVTVAAPPAHRAPFRSPLQAQTWFEQRMRGGSFPFMVGITMVVWTFFTMTGWGERAIETLAAVNEPQGIAAVVAAVTAPGLLLAQLLVIVPFLAAVAGAEVGGVRVVDLKPSVGTSGCHPFLALRPMTDGAFVLAKLRMAVRPTLTGWALVCLGFLLGFGLTGKWRELAGAPLLQGHGMLEVCATAAAWGAGLVLLTWLALTANLWLGLTGRRWFVNAVGGAAVIVWFALGLLASWLRSSAAMAAVLAAAPYVLAVAVLLKLLLAAWLARKLLQRDLVSPRVLAVAAAVWLLVAAGGVALLGRFAPDASSMICLALGVALLLPLNRYAAAPLALAWGRHR